MQGRFDKRVQERSTLRVFADQPGHGRAHPAGYESQPRLGACIRKVPCIKAIVDEGLRLIRTYGFAKCQPYDAQFLNQNSKTEGAAMALRCSVQCEHAACVQAGPCLAHTRTITT